MCELLFTFKPKILKYREPNKRNTSRSSITRLHSRWGKETYFKAKKCSKFRRRALLHDRVLKLILHAKAKGRSFLTTFAVILLAVTLPVVPKVEFNFDTIMYIPIFVFLSPRSCFKSVICIQNSLESAPVVMYSRRLKVGKILHQKGLRTLFSLIIHSETT